jgi:hypothetical protein
VNKEEGTKTRMSSVPFVSTRSGVNKTKNTRKLTSDQLNTAFTTTSSSEPLAIYEDTPQDNILQMNKIAKRTGIRDFAKIMSPCEWEGKEPYISRIQIDALTA